MNYNTAFANYESEAETKRKIKQAENEKYLQSQEWKDLLEKARQAKPESYTCVYKDTDGTFRESWHFISEDNIDYVKNKYTKAEKEIVYFNPMGNNGYGDILKQMIAGAENLFENGKNSLK